MRKVFGHGGLRLFLLMLLDEQPRHGYDLIKLVEDRFLGMYTPSAGTVYPRLQSLEDEGLIEHDEVDGRKIYRLTDAGRRELEERRAELEDVQERAVESARHLANAIRSEVRDSVRDMKFDLRQTMRDANREQRSAGRRARAEAQSAARTARRHWHGSADDDRDDTPRGGSRLELRALRADLDAFVEDVMDSVAEGGVDRVGLSRARDLLMDFRDTLVSELRPEEDPDAPGESGAEGRGAVNSEGAEAAPPG